MSIAALKQGVEAWLRSAGNFNDQPTQTIGKFFGVQPAPGKPPPNFGQYYVSIHSVAVRGRDTNPVSWDAEYDVMLTLTGRLNYAPRDRQGRQIATGANLDVLVDQLIAPNVIHGNYDLLTLANQLIVGTAEWCALQPGPPAATVNGFLEPLSFGSCSVERPVTGDWIGADETKGAFAIDMRFVKAGRIQYISTT